MVRELRGLSERFHAQPVCLGVLLEATAGRGLHWLLLLLALPFVTPLPMPGVSTPFGLLIALVGAGFAVGRKVWMPARLLAWRVPAPLAARLFAGAEGVARRLGFFMRPRLTFIVANGTSRRVAGLLTLVCGGLMTLPIPMPLTDGFPALTVVLLAAGALAGDGLLFLAGCALFGFTLVFFALLSRGGVEVLTRLSVLLGGT